MAAQQQRPVAALRLADLTAGEVLAFLDHSEKERSVSIGTRNCRLAALRSFFRFVADREPLAAGQCAEVLRIPIKRGPRRLICYLESAEVTAILAEPDRKTLDGQRDHALLALLYNTSRRLWICARRRFGWNLHANLKKPEMGAMFGSHGQPREPLGCGFDCDQPPQRHMAPKRIWCL